MEEGKPQSIDRENTVEALRTAVPVIDKTYMRSIRKLSDIISKHIIMVARKDAAIWVLKHFLLPQPLNVF